MAEKTGVRYKVRGSQVIPTEVEQAGLQSSIDISGLTASTEYEIVAYYDAGDGNEITSQTNYFKSATVAEYITFTNEYAGDNTLRITKNGTPASTDLSYSTDDGETWTDIHDGGSVNVREGEKILMKSSDGLNKDEFNYFSFTMAKAYSVSGHIASLWGYKYANMTTLPDYGCMYMFYNSETLISANIDFTGITTIGEYSCSNMFMFCTSLTTGPDLSRVTSIGYRGCFAMFNGCISLATATDLSGMTSIRNDGCGNMFKSCTSLTTPSNLSNVTDVGVEGCSGMFRDCTSLTTPPDLSNVTAIGNWGCYVMLGGCTSLTTPADLTNVVSVGNYGCRDLYYGCESLSSAYTPNISSWNTRDFETWLKNAGSQVSGTKTVYKPSALSIPIDSDSGVPVGWVVDDFN